MSPRYANGESGDVVNIRTLTTHIGFVRTAVMAPVIPGHHVCCGSSQRRPTGLRRANQIIYWGHFEGGVAVCQSFLQCLVASGKSEYQGAFKHAS